LTARACCTPPTPAAAIGSERDHRAIPGGNQVASHFGGTRNPMIARWPRGIMTGMTEDAVINIKDASHTITSDRGRGHARFL
jgi:arylsulfatase A-like enzyme